MERQTFTEDAAGCYLDGHRGHYVIRDMIELAVDNGFIVGPFEKYALDRYEDGHHEDDYPYDAMIELADEAETWLNCGDNSGPDRAIKGQNSPPIIPDGYYWGWSDGDFGLYPIEDEV